MMDSNPRYLNEIESDILTRILENLRAEDAMTSDGSALRHFETEGYNTKEKIIARLSAEFGCNVDPVYDLDFGELFKYLEKNMKARTR